MNALNNKDAAYDARIVRVVETAPLVSWDLKTGNLFTAVGTYNRDLSASGSMFKAHIADRSEVAVLAGADIDYYMVTEGQPVRLLAVIDRLFVPRDLRNFGIATSLMQSVIESVNTYREQGVSIDLAITIDEEGTVSPKRFARWLKTLGFDTHTLGTCMIRRA